MESLKLSEFGVFQTVVKGAGVEKEGRQELDHLDSFMATVWILFCVQWRQMKGFEQGSKML